MQLDAHQVVLFQYVLMIGRPDVSCLYKQQAQLLLK